jgi:hydrogenase maturation protein HypF
MELEALAESWHRAPELPYPFTISDSDLLYLDSSPMWKALLEDLSQQLPAAQMAARFHLGLAQAIREMIARIRSSDADARVNTIALSGGCFQNKLLLEDLVRLLEADGLRCLLQTKVPTNDGGLALGQAAIAAARYLNRSN